MKKQRKQLIILLVILVILAAGFYGIRQYNKVQSNKAQDDTITAVVTVDPEDIVKISYEYEGETYTMEKEEDTWYDAADHSQNLIQYRITSIANTLASLSATQVIENVTDMSQYGLVEGYRTISFETASESYIFYLGEQNTITKDYYICKPSESTVYAVESSFVSKFNYSLDDMVEEEEESTEQESTEQEGTEQEGTEQESTEQESTEQESENHASTEEAGEEIQQKE